MAPILPFTAEEAWAAMPASAGRPDSVHLALFPEFGRTVMAGDEAAAWEDLRAIREIVLKELEKAREEKLIGNSLEARVTLRVPNAQSALLTTHADELKDLFIVSDVVIGAGGDGALTVAVDKAPGRKCARCWNYSTSVGTSAAHPDFCRRCDDVVEGRAE
jgi:isoleucyl-tRNA synthetase